MAEQFLMKNKDGVVRMTTLKYEGIVWPTIVPDPVKAVDDAKKFPYKDGDLFVCSYPRTGSNWMLDMLAMVRNNSTDINTDMTPPVELMPGFSVAKTPPRTLLSHMPYRLMPEAHVKSGGKIILMCRNPKDTVVSTFHFAKKNKADPYTGDLEEFLQYFTSGETIFSGYIQYFQDWDQTLKANPDLPVLIVHYEDLKQNCVAQLRRICEFLELDRPDSFLQDVANKNVVSKVKAAKETSPGLQPFMKATSTEGDLHFYRKGIVGDWKTHFTVAQNERFDQVFNEQLKDTMFCPAILQQSETDTPL